MTQIKSLTIDLNVDELSIPFDIKKVNIGELMIRYNFSIVDQSNYDKLSMVTSELVENDNIVIGYACHNLEDLLHINEELVKYNLSLDTIYIPSQERIGQRIQKAIEEQKSWGYRDGISDEEIERNFNNFSAILQEIKDGLSETSIKVMEI